MACQSYGNRRILDIIQNGDIAELREYISEDNSSVPIDDDGRTPLMLASFYGKPDMVLFLIKTGADVNGITPDGWTPLRYAAIKGGVEVAKILIDNGADINTPSDSPPLVTAAWYQHEELVKLLLDNGANPNSPPALALFRAVDGFNSVLQAMGRFDLRHKINNAIIDLLIDHGADVNAQTAELGLTALMKASSLGNMEAVVTLLRRGAKVDIATWHGGLTAIDLAETHNHSDIVDLLLTAKSGKHIDAIVRDPINSH